MIFSSLSLWSMAYCMAMPPPMDQPRMEKLSQPMASAKASTSSEKSRMPRFASTGRASVSPKQRMSGATISKVSSSRFISGR